MVRFAAEFGMTPASRSGMDVAFGAATSPTKQGGTDYYD